MPRKTAKDEADDGGDFDDGEAGNSLNGGGSCFYINKSGLPVDSPTWERMWDHVMTVHPDGARIQQDIRSHRHLPEVPVPHAPVTFPQDLTTLEKIEAVQKYLQQLQYNHTGTQFFDIKKGRPLCGLMDCAKDMIRESLPIKCLEAVILAVYLTNPLTSVDRFPISFRSVFKGNIYRHVVLGIHFNGRYGAVGLSRRDDLMFKPLKYSQLSEMVLDFQKAYRKYWHTVDKVKVGLAVSHDPHTYECIHWRAISLNLKKLSHHDICHELDKFSREIRKQTTRYQATTTSAQVVRHETKARSLSPKKHVISHVHQPHPPSTGARTSKTHHRIQGYLLRDQTVNAVFVADHGVGDTVQYDEENYPMLQRRKSNPATFSTTEIYDIRI
jgi:hypothetical protein